MKVRSLSFRRFGAFEDRTLTFPDGKNLHIIFGPNEAGKSTSLAGLGYFLFGFPARASYSFRYQPSEQRIAATLIDNSGAEWTAIRRRGQARNSLRAADDKTPIADERLVQLLGGLDKTQFEMLFGLNHDELVAGGTMIAEGKGGLGQALFAAGAGLAGLRRIDERLGNRLDAIFKRAGIKQTIPKLLAELKAERKNLADRTIAIDAWASQKDQLDGALAEQAELEAERASLRAEQDRLKTLRAAMPTVASLRGVEEQMRSLTDAALLPADFATLYRVTIEELKTAQAGRDRHQGDVATLTARAEAIAQEPHVLAEDDAILQVKEDLGAIVKADRDREPLHARMREHQGEAHRTLVNCFKRDDLTSAETLRVSQAEQDRIRSLGEQRAAVTQAVDASRDRLAQLEGQIADLERQVGAASVLVDDAELERLDRAILAEGKLDQSVAEKREDLRRDRDAVERDIARLEPFWKGTMNQLIRLAPPAAERIDETEKSLDDAEAEIREAEKTRDAEARRMRECARQLDSIEQAGHIPDEDELSAARAARDADVERLIAGDLSRGDVVREEIAAADGAVDTARREANRVAEMARCRADLRAAEEEHAAALQTLSERTHRRDEILFQWGREWKPAGIDPATPAEMRVWRGHWENLRGRIESLEQSARDLKRSIHILDEHRGRVRAALELGDREKDASLARLHDLLKSAIDAARAARAARAGLDRSLQSARAERDRVERQHTEATRQLEAWRDDWGRAVAVIGLDADASPGTASRYLDHLGEIFRELREAQTIELRLKGIDRDRGQFAARLEALTHRVLANGPLDATKLEVAVDELVRRLNDAKRRHGEREAIEKSLATSKAALAKADQSVVKSEARIQALCEQAGIMTPEELPKLISDSERRRELDERLAELRAALRHLGGEPDAFLAEIEASRGTLEARLVEIESRLAAIDVEIPRRAVVADAAQQTIQRWQSDSCAAADHQQAIESILAQLREHASEYAAVHLARQTLRLTIERFRQRGHDTLLTQAECRFRTLTRGAFRGIDIDADDDNEPVLRAVRASPEERVDVGGLSDGTRDQLFLALRLAGIEQHLRSHGPMPVVVDDILINFDEDREAATIECLAELSRQTQVLVFTHHAHVVEIANRIAPDAVCCHDLSK